MRMRTHPRLRHHRLTATVAATALTTAAFAGALATAALSNFPLAAFTPGQSLGQESLRREEPGARSQPACQRNARVNRLRLPTGRSRECPRALPTGLQP